MKFKSIAAICKEDQTLAIFECQDRKNVQQWIGTPSALYPLSDVPRMKKEGFCSILDIPQSKREDFTFIEDAAPADICFEDAMKGERQLDEPVLTLCSLDRTLRFYPSDQFGIVCMDERYLAPLSDVQSYLTIHERITPYGRPYFAAKMGFLLLAIIMPYDIIKPEFVDGMELFCTRCRRALAVKGIRKLSTPSAQQYGIDEDGTITPHDINPETGEITEEAAHA